MFKIIIYVIIYEYYHQKAIINHIYFRLNDYISYFELKWIK